MCFTYVSSMVMCTCMKQVFTLFPARHCTQTEVIISVIIMNHDSGFIIGIAYDFLQNSNRTHT